MEGFIQSILGFIESSEDPSVIYSKTKENSMLCYTKRSNFYPYLAFQNRKSHKRPTVNVA
jgi:hypothetical protein